MKKLLSILGILLLAVAAFGQPPLHYAARTDMNVAQLPKPLPTWGGANGLCTTYKNPAFPGSTIVSGDGGRSCRNIIVLVPVIRHGVRLSTASIMG